MVEKGYPLEGVGDRDLGKKINYDGWVGRKLLCIGRSGCVPILYPLI